MKYAHTGQTEMPSNHRSKRQILAPLEHNPLSQSLVTQTSELFLSKHRILKNHVGCQRQVLNRGCMSSQSQRCSLITNAHRISCLRHKLGAGQQPKEQLQGILWRKPTHFKFICMLSIKLYISNVKTNTSSPSNHTVTYTEWNVTSDRKLQRFRCTETFGHEIPNHKIYFNIL